MDHNHNLRRARWANGVFVPAEPDLELSDSSNNSTPDPSLRRSLPQSPVSPTEGGGIDSFETDGGGKVVQVKEEQKKDFHPDSASQPLNYGFSCGPNGLVIKSERINPRWVFTDEQLSMTPTIRLGGARDDEERFRRRAIRFLVGLGHLTEAYFGYNYESGCSPATISPAGTPGSLSQSINGEPLPPKVPRYVYTAALFLHRFYMIHPMQIFPIYETACACYYFASKVEERMKNCEIIVKMARQLADQPTGVVKFLQQDSNFIYNTIHQIEAALVMTMGFQFHNSQPYRYVVECVDFIIGPPDKMREVNRRAFGFIDHSIHTTLCLQWDPKAIAIAGVIMALRCNDYKVVAWKNMSRNPNEKWYEAYDPTIKSEWIIGIQNVLSRHLEGVARAHAEHKASALQQQSASDQDTENTLTKNNFGLLPNSSGAAPKPLFVKRHPSGPWLPLSSPISNERLPQQNRYISQQGSRDVFNTISPRLNSSSSGGAPKPLFVKTHPWTLDGPWMPMPLDLKQKPLQQNGCPQPQRSEDLFKTKNPRPLSSSQDHPEGLKKPRLN